MISDKVRLNFAVLLALAWAVVAVLLLTQFWGMAGTAISDPDDAMRLVQVREFLAGRGWFDLAEPRLDPPYGYLTHWSRLTDLGLAGVFLLARLFVLPERAEQIMMGVYPVLWVIPAMAGVAAIAWRCAGRNAALAALAMVVLGLPAFQNFQPGRIDHHDAQITLATLTIAAAVWSDRCARAGIMAGVLSALAFAVGLESLPWVVLAGAAMALRFVFDARCAPALRNYGIALASGTLAAFFISVDPSRWSVSVCDALAVNYAVPVIAAGISLAISVLLVPPSLLARVIAVGICGVIAAILFAVIEPRCLRGPFAMVDPIVLQIWLSRVEEMSPLTIILRSTPLTGVWVSAFPAVALIAAVLLGRTSLRRDFGFLVAGASLAVAVVLTFVTVKTYSYAMWFAMPLAAVGVVQFNAHFKLSRALSVVTTFMLTPVVVSAVAITLLQNFVPQPTTANSARQVCFSKRNYAALAKLPAGVIAADIDFGPMLLAFTPHAVVAAPYHRLSHGIVAANRIFSSSTEEARKTLIETRTRYIVLCGATRPTVLGNDDAANSFWARLVANDLPPWLERVALQEKNPFVVYRVGP